ncbi:hypothetical protein [uncultured Thiocystis sp.]|jgi:chromosome segregation ATPase|uniref:hypothetical protein n=1 Tax=uncultured Thiocystis sp. TaxID=1202134 RepID=UPI0025D35503|nr:hypothetical protein [uncultured Thiocystis sp.]
MNKYVSTSLVAVLFSGCATGPDLANDPRSGGFFGGLAGVVRGDYDARKQEREDALASIRVANQSLKQDNQGLEITKNAKQSEVRNLKRQVAKLDGDVQSLSAQVANLRKRSGSAESANLQQRVGSLDKRTSALKHRTGGADTAALTKEKAQLEKEYGALLQTYMVLNDTGGSTKARPASAGLQDMPK